MAPIIPFISEEIYKNLSKESESIHLSSFPSYNKENTDFINKEYNLKDFDQILCSPGISKSNYEKLIKEHNNVLTDIDIFFHIDKSINLLLML